MIEFYVIGAGDAGKDIRHTVEALNQQKQEYTILGYIDEDKGKHGQQYAGIKVQGGLDYLTGLKKRAQAICTIGEARNKKRIVEQIGEKVDWINIIHPNASCAQDLDLGQGNYIYSFVTISRDVSIGSHCFINSHVLVGHDIQIGDYCSIQPGAMLVENVTLGPACYIGTGSILYGEITVGAGSIISAGSVVGSNVPENALVMGNPARIVKKIR